MPLTEADADKAYALACDAIQHRVRDRIGPRCIVFFSGYVLDADKVPIDNLDDVPFPGKLRIKRSRVRRIQRSEDYESAILENPSWLDLCVIANDQITVTRDRDHRYLEDIEIIEVIDGVQIAALRLES
jgi:hypothetical protein